MESITLAIVGFAFLWSSKNISTGEGDDKELLQNIQATVGYVLISIAMCILYLGGDFK